ncbi:ricin-type beta-trefoil lectin domain protein [Streptomyces sp. NPDC005533]|uniref:RICIN domain-containing protein n=1 Tax=Streptomyces sp. NPDC005533 TaxID=3364723 RepID=UPI0036BA1955
MEVEMSKFRRLMSATMLCALSAAAPFVAAPSAYAAVGAIELSGQIGLGLDFCMDAHTNTVGTKVQLYGCNLTTHAQEFTFYQDGTLRRGFTEEGEGGGRCVNARADGLLWLDNCQAASMQWLPQANGALYNPVIDKCISYPQPAPGTVTADPYVNSTQLVAAPCNDGEYQNWTLPNWGRIKHIGSGKCVDGYGDWVGNNWKVRIMDCAGASNLEQRWAFENGRIRNMRDETRCLTPESGTAPGTKVSIGTCWGYRSTSQDWTLGADGLVKHNLTGLCLDLPGNVATNNTWLQLNTCTVQPSTTWAFPPIGGIVR